MQIELRLYAETFSELLVQLEDLLGRPASPPEAASSPGQRETKPTRKRPVRAPVVEPVPDSEYADPDPGALDDMPEPAEEPETMGDALANETLKKQVMAELQAMFVAGKIKVVRHLLNKYGDGAKSFPEIDAGKFAAIKQALDRGEAA